jgi:hypothetical protein
MPVVYVDVHSRTENLQTLNARGVSGFSDEKYVSRNRTKERSGKTMVTTRWKRGRYSDCSCWQQDDSARAV